MREFVELDLSEEEVEQLKDFDGFEQVEGGFYMDNHAIDSIVDSVVFNGNEEELANKIYDARDQERGYEIHISWLED